MKKLVLLFTIATLSVTHSFAQDSKGYIGASIGLALPMGDTADGIDPGLELNLINAGYRFNETWGITMNWGANAHKAKEDSEITAAFGYLGIGPMISFGGFDIKPQYAFASGVIEGYGEKLTYDGSGFILGGTYNFSLSDHWGIATNADYSSFKMDDAEESDSFFKLSIGIQYRF